ncbi:MULTISPECIES: hypothetical protein [unclassified Enterococcus]|uniref:hypothetical protein n=1 Tax=unclassified Enterococcus TaxID=2608891 RepID=UPI001CE1408E|nr:MULTISPECIES: hypothetical protein [unclassified Enterococcus]MCA5014126.1 hypothetical protein [Enterococcus sp. S23]MCA5017654.1 hypothetical protein [Enterococcus sp. S22(2020)]
MSVKIHDFSQASIEELNRIMSEVEDDGQWGIFDTIGDWTMGIPELEQSQESFQEHFQAIVDKHNIGVKDFDTILEEIHKVDKEYAAQFDSILSEMEVFGNKLKNVAQLITPSVITSSQGKFTEILGVIHSKEINDLYRKCTENDQLWKDILSKDAGGISNEEYAALALVYTTVDADKLDDFLNACMNKNEDVDYNFAVEFQGLQDHTSWIVDKEKVDQILSMIQVMRDNSVILLQYVDRDSEEEFYKEVKAYSDDLMQRMTLLSVSKEIGIFNGTHKKDSPEIVLVRNEDGSLNLSFRETKLIYEPGMKSVVSMDLYPSSVIISNTKNGEGIDIDALENSRIAFSEYFEAPSIEEASASFASDQVKSVVTDGMLDAARAGAKKAGKIGLSKAIGFIPIVGDVAGAGIDYYNDMQEHNKDVSFIDGQLTDLEESIIYADFDCSTSRVVYDTSNVSGNIVFVKPGQDTFNRLNRLNEAWGTNYTLDDILYRPKEIFDKAAELNNDITKKDLYDEAINNK